MIHDASDTPIVYQPIARLCRACGCAFVIDVTELEWWRQLAARSVARDVVRLPWRCTECRIAVRRAREQVIEDGDDETIACADCGADFQFTVGEKSYYQARNYAKPRRCSGCREARKIQSGGSRG